MAGCSHPQLLALELNGTAATAFSSGGQAGGVCWVVIGAYQLHVDDASMQAG